MSSSTPALSVVMSVYNAEAYLRPAIESILGQTFTDFEFIIIDDGSSDDSRDIIKSYGDSRIKLLTQDNHGLVYSLNRGIKEAKAAYIARMDADDISHPSRFEEQMKVIASDPDLALVGSIFEMTDEHDRVLATFVPPTSDIDIKRALYLRNPLGHGSMIMAKAAVVAAGGYRDNVGPVEDYDLWIRLYELGGRFQSVPKALYSWRNNPAGVSWTTTEAQQSGAQKLRDELWQDHNLPDARLSRLIMAAYAYAASSGHYGLKLASQYARDQYQLMRASWSHGYGAQAIRQAVVVIAILPFSLAAGLLGLGRWADRRYHTVRHWLGQNLRRWGLR